MIYLLPYLLDYSKRKYIKIKENKNNKNLNLNKIVLNKYHKP